MNQLIPQPPWGCCEIPGDMGARITKEEGDIRFFRAPDVAFRGIRSRPSGWGGREPFGISRFQTQLWKVVFSEDTYSKGSTGNVPSSNQDPTWQPMAEVVHRALKGARRSDNRSFSEAV